MQNHEILELAFVIVAALALTMQTVILFALYLGVTKSIKSIKQEIEEVRTSVMPTIEKTRDVVEKTRDIIDRLSPKVEQTVADVSDIVHRARAQAAEIESVTAEVLARVRKETGRVDSMFANTLDAVDKAGEFVTRAVSKPMRQVAGVLASVKAIVESLSAPQTVRGNNVHRDEDMFV